MKSKSKSKKVIPLKRKRTNKSILAQAQVPVPGAFDNCIMSFVNSHLQFRGDEPKSLLGDGRLFVQAQKMAVIPLEHYKSMLDLGQRGVSNEKTLAVAMALLEKVLVENKISSVSIDAELLKANYSRAYFVRKDEQGGATFSMVDQEEVRKGIKEKEVQAS